MINLILLGIFLNSMPTLFDWQHDQKNKEIAHQLITEQAFDNSNESNYKKTINFAGLTWYIKQGKHTGTGYNNWSNSSKSVWVDKKGRLHLKIRKRGKSWYASEIYSQKYVNLGEYTFQLSSNPEEYDPNIVVGLFIYENDNQEIDIELSKWGDPSRKEVGQYVIQPFKKNGNLFKFDLNLTSQNSTHKIFWEKDRVAFKSYHGHYPKLPKSDLLIAEWENKGKELLKDNGKKKLHINLWLKDGKSPINGEEAELIISDVMIRN